MSSELGLGDARLGAGQQHQGPRWSFGVAMETPVWDECCVSGLDCSEKVLASTVTVFSNGRFLCRYPKKVDLSLSNFSNQFISA